VIQERYRRQQKDAAVEEEILERKSLRETAASMHLFASILVCTKVGILCSSVCG
jgi:hypothetical protein